MLCTLRLLRLNTSIGHTRCIHMTTSASLPAQVQQQAAQLPRLVLSPGSAHHSSLASFLDYARRIRLSTSSPVYVGTHYEYTVALALLRLGFSLLRIGKKADAGIDLIGHWCLPPLPEPTCVIVQCKARRNSCAPSAVRELEGAFQAVPPSWRTKNVLGILANTQKATKGVLAALKSNPKPMGFLKVTREGDIEQFVWNRAAGERGLEGVGVTIRHTPHLVRTTAKEVSEQGQEGTTWEAPQKTRWKKHFADVGTKKDMQLTWLGEPIFPDREELDTETLMLDEGTLTKVAKRRGRPPGAKDRLPRRRRTRSELEGTTKGG